jgi:hypothetical protein
MRRLSILILIFSIAFTMFFFSPSLLSQQFGIYPLMKIGDVLDILTPLVLIPLYWLLFRLDINKTPSLEENLIFMVLTAFWIAGQSMHLAANSIGHLLKGMEGSDVYYLTYFYDEVLSHYLWHFGIVSLLTLTIFRQWRNPFTEGRPVLWLPVVAGIIHGFALFVIFIEGGTALLGVPFVALVALFGSTRGWKRFNQQPLLLFAFVACLVAIAFFAGWAAYWGGMPELSEVGIID